MSNILDSSDLKNNIGPRYFKNPILERLAYTSTLTLNIIFVPIALFFCYSAFLRHSFTVAIVGICAGLLLWSLVEYVMHRFAFHFKFKNENLKWLHSIFHLSHHQYPHDKRKYQTLILLSLPSGILYYFILKFAAGSYIEPIFSGFIIGYLLYEFAHYSTHKLKMDSKTLKRLKQHHMHHHFLDQEKNFGVTSALWDIIFKTQLTEDKKMILLKKKQL